MFNVGDKIVYPMHGAGVIEAIEEKEFLGNRQRYYVLKMPLNGMRVLIPTSNVEGIGIREVIPKSEVQKVIQLLSAYCPDVKLNWNKRYRENMQKIKSGSVYEVAKVVKELMAREKEKGLSTGEKKMLNSARQILISELILSMECDENTIQSAIEKCIKKDT